MNINRFWQARDIILVIAIIFGLPARSVRPAEDAIYTVNNLGDTNDGTCSVSNCTLREAINVANASAAVDTIQFSLSGTITLGSILPTIRAAGGALTIDGANRSIIINGADSDRILYIESGATLALQDLDLRNGYITNDGGAIYSRGVLTLNDCALSENRAMNHGGAIYTEGTLSLTNTSFTGNSTDTGSGGALYIHEGNVYITGGVFLENGATYSGGAIYNRYEGESSGGDLTISGTMFIENSAGGGSGGAIANDSDLSIDGAFFSRNSTEENGGAVYNDTGGEYQIRDSAFHYNTASLGNGGGLYADNISDPSSVYDSTFTHNQATFNGGGFYIFRGTALFQQTNFSDNDAVSDGGGGYNKDGLVYLLGDTFAYNHAGQHGGGFYNDQNMVIKYSLFSGNRADDNGGGVHHAASAAPTGIENTTFYGNSAALGGGLFTRANMDVTNCTFSANSAGANGGGAINFGAGTYLLNTIFAYSASGGNCNISVPVDQGNNIDSGATCGFSPLKGSMSNTNPMLEALKNNGGDTQTMMPMFDSPAVDAVIYNSPNECPDDDQRYFPRPYGARCDIGAVERYRRIYLPVTLRN